MANLVVKGEIKRFRKVALKARTRWIFFLFCLCARGWSGRCYDDDDGSSAKMQSLRPYSRLVCLSGFKVRKASLRSPLLFSFSSRFAVNAAGAIISYRFSGNVKARSWLHRRSKYSRFQLLLLVLLNTTLSERRFKPIMPSEWRRIRVPLMKATPNEVNLIISLTERLFTYVLIRTIEFLCEGKF